MTSALSAGTWLLAARERGTVISGGFNSPPSIYSLWTVPSFPLCFSWTEKGWLFEANSPIGARELVLTPSGTSIYRLSPHPGPLPSLLYAQSTPEHWHVTLCIKTYTHLSIIKTTLYSSPRFLNLGSGFKGVCFPENTCKIRYVWRSMSFSKHSRGWFMT